MTRTLAGADIRGYYAALGIPIADWDRTEASVRCFADPDAHQHADRKPSCSINLQHGAWHCHACGATGGAFDAATTRGYSARAAIDLMVAHGLTQYRASQPTQPRPRSHVPSPPSRAPAPGPPRMALRETEDAIAGWQAALAADADLIQRLIRGRGWLYATMLELQLGVDRGRITIPVRDDTRRLIGVLRYQPWPKPREAKMLAARGSHRVLLPHPAAERSRQVLLVEGEPDMIAARSRGLPAIAVPGAAGWRREWAQLLADRQVTISMDADPEGRLAAQRIERDLRGYCECAIVDIAPDRTDGFDLTQWLLREHIRERADVEAKLLSPRCASQPTIGRRRVGR